MTFVRGKARILERTITAGNGPYALAGAVDGSYNSFASFMAIGDTTYVSVTEPGVAFWTGIATYSAANQLTMTTVEETKGTFGAGTKEIFAGARVADQLFREDIAGAIVSGGSSTAYTVASYRKYDTLARLDGNLIAFTPHVTSGAAPTLNADGLGDKPLRAVPGADLLPGVLIQGTPYLALYNNTDGVFYLHAMFGNPYNVPLGAGMDYWLPTTPNSAFAFPAGQAISRTTYAALFAAMGTTYGPGDGSTTFNLPDKTGRSSVMKEATATRLTSTYFGGNSTVLGAVGGLESHTLAASEIPAHSHPNTLNDPGHAHSDSAVRAGGAALSGGSAPSVAANTNTAGSTGGTTTGIAINNVNNTGGGGAHANVPPTIVCNYILRVL